MFEGGDWRIVCTWPGEPSQTSTSARNLASTIQAEHNARAIPPEALRRNDDPAQSHRAIELFEPSRGTRKAQALALLRAHIGDWIDAPEFTTETTGGFSGTRRVRELRDEGWPIDIREKPGAINTWQYRLNFDPPEQESHAAG